jgi:hypothetical protein
MRVVAQVVAQLSKSGMPMLALLQAIENASAFKGFNEQLLKLYELDCWNGTILNVAHGNDPCLHGIPVFMHLSSIELHSCPIWPSPHPCTAMDFVPFGGKCKDLCKLRSAHLESFNENGIMDY